MTLETYSEIGLLRPSIVKSPGAEKDYTFDFTDWLALYSDSIASYMLSVDGVVLESDAQAGDLITVWISGGAERLGGSGSVTCTITTVGGRTEVRTIYFLIRNV